MITRNRRAARHEQQAREVEASQSGLRQSIAETNRLVGESEIMLRRHREEREQDELDD